MRVDDRDPTPSPQPCHSTTRLATEPWPRVTPASTGCSSSESRPRGSIAARSARRGRRAATGCRFFSNSALAEREGFRPCLRCRPELAPGHAPVDSVRRTARAAARRIEAGALNDGGSLEQLARDLGLSSRQLRRAVKQEFGVSPVELAQTQRLLLAKQLLTESNLPIIQVAFASGFESVRRFNALFRSHYRLTPTHMRRSSTTSYAGDCVRLTLAYRPPLAWNALLRFLAGGRRRESNRSRIRLTSGRPPSEATGAGSRSSRFRDGTPWRSSWRRR